MSQDNYTALICASKNNQLAVVDFLLSHDSCEVNFQGGWNQTTALMKAVDRNFIGCAKTLIDNGAEGLCNTVCV